MREKKSLSVTIEEPDWLHQMVEKLVEKTISELVPKPSQPQYADFEGLLRHLYFAKPRTVRQWVVDGKLPRIKPPGSRKLYFHLPSVDAALLRFQRGGIE